MIILGVDPGTNFLGYAVIKVIKDKIYVLEAGDVKLNKLPLHDQKLKKILVKLNTVIAAYDPEVMAIEAPFYGKNPQSMLKLGRAQGVAIAAGAINQLDVFEYAPKKIKQSITGSGQASKEQVAQMLKHILTNSIEVKSLDASDALGVAVCHYLQTKNPLFSKGGSSDWADFVKKNQDRIV